MGWGTDQAADTSGGWGKDPVAAPPVRTPGDTSIGRKIDAGVRGAADMLSFGFADELAAAGDSIPDFVKGGTQGFSKAYQQNLQRERGTDQADKADVPVSRGVGQAAGFVGGLAGGAVVDAGRLVPNAIRGGGIVGNVARGAVTGAGYGELSGAGQGDGNIPDRLRQAVPSAVVGAAVGGAIPVVAEGVSAGVNALANRSASPLDRAANALRGSTDVPAAQARVNDLRTAGAQPSFASGTDESGRGFIRAAASRQTPARQIVQDRAETAALNLPDRIGQQARTNLSADPRTPDQIATELGAQRGAAADQAFGAVRGQEIQMPPETIQALRTGQGRAAITEAAQRERDPEVRASLNRLANAALDDPSTPITVGMADRISRVLAGRAQAANRAGDNDLAATLGGLSRSVREPAASAVPGYRAALDQYGAQSRVMAAADQGEDFLRRNTDEFVAQTPGPGQPGNDLSRATARRAIERAAGESTAAAPGVARRIANAPEQQARNAALLGPEGAQRLQTGMAAEARTVRDLNDVAPRTGSQTQLRTADQATASGIATAAHVVSGGHTAWAGLLINRMKTLGLSDHDAQAVADIATDPAQVDELLRRIAAHGNPQVAQRIGGIINQITGRAAGQLTPQPQQ